MTRPRTARGVLASILALALGLGALAPAQAAESGLVPTAPPTIVSSAAEQPVDTWFVYTGGWSRPPASISTFVSRVTGLRDASSCGMRTTSTTIEYCVRHKLAAVVLGPGTDARETLTVGVPASLASEGALSAEDTSLTVAVHRHAAPAAPSTPHMVSSGGTAMSGDFAATSTAGALAYAAPSVPPGATVNGSGVSWNGLSGGAVTLRATDPIGQTVTYQVLLVRLAAVDVPVTSRTVATGLSHLVDVATPGRTADTRYRFSSGSVPGSSLHATSTGYRLVVDVATAGTYDAVVEAYQAVDGVDHVLGSGRLTLVLRDGPTVVAPTHNLLAHVGRPVDATVVLSEDREVLGVSHSGGPTWAAWTVVSTDGGSMTARVTGVPTAAGSATRTFDLTNGTKVSRVAVDVLVAGSPVPTATVAARASGAEVPTAGGAVDFDVVWRDSVSAGAPVAIPVVVDPADVVVTGALDPVVTVTETAVGTWTLSVSGSGWTGTEVGVTLPPGVVEDAWGVGNAAASAVATIVPVAVPTATLPASVDGVVGTALSFDMVVATGAADGRVTVSAVDVPAWLTLSGTTLSGTPVAAGESTVVLDVTDSLGQVTRVSTQVRVAPAPVAPTFVGAGGMPAPLTAQGEVGTPFTLELGTVGYPAAALWLVRVAPSGVAPSLPGPARAVPTTLGWVSLTDHGDGSATLSGTPTVAGDVDVTVRAYSASGSVDHTVRVGVVAAPKPTTSPEPTTTPEPTASTEPTTSPEPTASPEPTVSPDPSTTSEPTSAPTASESPERTESSEPTTSPGLADGGLPVTGATTVVGLGVALLLAVGGTVLLAVRRRAA